jgi:hypothetical protein
LGASLFTDVSAFAIPLAAATTVVSVNARRYFMAEIMVVGSKCWIVMALCPKGWLATDFWVRTFGRPDLPVSKTNFLFSPL